MSIKFSRSKLGTLSFGDSNVTLSESVALDMEFVWMVRKLRV